MFEMNFYMPTEIVWGRGCINKNPSKLALGKKAIIVCGRNSAKACGALDDVTAALASLGIDYEIFNKITENPPIEVCYEGGRLAVSINADFVIGIGGGSPLDASKAIAAYAADESLEMEDIFTDKVKKVLPIAAIPTTAGTGSEVDAASVLTLTSGKVKKSFKTHDTYPKVAFLDADYTESLNLEYTISTALDAFCHCVESYLSPKSTIISRMFAMRGAQMIYSALGDIAEMNKNIDLKLISDLREPLLAGASMGGIAIGTTGTGFNHPLGYNLTLYKGIPHGRACAVFMREYFDYNSRSDEGRALIEHFCGGLLASPDEVAENIVNWSDVNLSLTDSEIDEYITNVKGAKNYSNSPYVIDESEMREIYNELFKRK